MSEERTKILRQIRESLEELGAEGVDFVAAGAKQPASESPPAQPAKQEPSSFVPRVAALADSGPHSELGEEAASRLAAVRQELGECTRCKLCDTRKTIVFGEGSPEAPVVFVGEGPGDEEDRSGRPFVGRSGELLTKMIESVGWKREEIYICNIVKCRPPKNRNPERDEIEACQAFLEKQILAIRPVALITLGKPAISTLLGREVPITRERGIWQEWNGIRLMPTFHPAYVLRSYTQKNRQAVWDDLQAVRALVDETRPS
ncbi:MAG: uracil-DNA glycosylase [bacterium]|nr:uracil-DNA glycosylase [bacterium]